MCVTSTGVQEYDSAWISSTCGVEGPCDELMLLLQAPDMILDFFRGSLRHHHLSIQVPQQVQVCSEIACFVESCSSERKHCCCNLQHV